MHSEVKNTSVAALAANNLSRSFGAIKALDGLSFSVYPGELYGLVGPDGAGKTTAIRALAGLIDRDAGQAQVMGNDSITGSRSIREAIGLMPQQYSLYRDLSVAENLDFFSRLYVLPRNVFQKRAKRLLHITRLAPFVDRRADALSGGMYKKLALACALLHEPKVLLLDEPTNGVDPVSRRELWALLHEFVSAGMAVLVSTPYMDEAERCDRIGLIHHGKLLCEGRPNTLLAEFSDEAYEVVGGNREQLDRVLLQMSEVKTILPAGSRLNITIAKGSSAVVNTAIAPLQTKLIPRTPIFEDVFLSRIGQG
ncbi:MAG: ABC transporter ATP-binding protein [Deltaproteobacteria bacterium]|nr:ABC transporter ATP-binding protein [Deltaproteobacteria bacterium]